MPFIKSMPYRVDTKMTGITKGKPRTETNPNPPPALEARACNKASREARAKSEELRTKSREMIRSGITLIIIVNVIIIVIITIIRSGGQETMAAWSVTNRSTLLQTEQ